MSASGYYGLVPFIPSPVVTSILTFVSNKGKVLGPYGKQQGTPFTLPVEGGRIIGFIGRSGTVVDAIGFRLSPNP